MNKQKSKFLWFDLEDFTFHKRELDKNRILLTDEQKRELIFAYNSPPDLFESEFEVINGMPQVKYVDIPVDFIKNRYRGMREHECFPIINRSQMWHNRLSTTQKEELEKWYDDWLNITDTMEIPEKLD